MAKIDFLRQNGDDVVTNTTDKVLYPVTTANAVYYTQQKTLSNILDGEYNPKNNANDNGIFAWLDNLTKKSDEFYLKSEAESLKKNIVSLDDSVKNISTKCDKIEDNVKSIATNLSKEIIKLGNGMFTPEFDSAPTKGSKNLLTSGTLFSYLGKVINNNIFDFKKVTNLDEYNYAENGEVVINIGETNDKYVFGGMYQASVTYDGDNSICSDKNKTLTWKLLGNTLNEGSSIDLSDYCKTENVYSKKDIDLKLSDISKIEYTAGANINIADNVISATVPDVSNLVTRQEAKAIAAEEANKTKPIEYSAGNNIKIDDKNIISVDVDDELNENSYKPISNKAVAEALKKTGSGVTKTYNIMIPQNSVTSKTFVRKIVLDKPTTDYRLVNVMFGCTSGGYVDLNECDLIAGYYLGFDFMLTNNSKIRDVSFIRDSVGNDSAGYQYCLSFIINKYVYGESHPIIAAIDARPSYVDLFRHDDIIINVTVTDL